MILQQTIFNAIGGAGGGGGIGGAISSLFFANGGIAKGGIDFGAFSTGGTVTRPTVGLVGEGAYNEAIVPLPDGQSIPVEMKGGGAGGAIINNYITVESGAGGSDQDKQKLALAIKYQIKEVIGQEKRFGGILYQGV